MNEIHEKADQINWDDYEEIIEFYQDHQEYFDNYSELTDQDTIFRFIRTKQHYANALFHKGLHDKVLLLIGQMEELQQKLEKSHPDWHKTDRFTHFLKGLVWANQRKYRLSLPIFRELLKEEPENADYRLWYNHSRFGKYKVILNIAILLGVAFIWLHMLTDFEEQYGINLNVAGIALLVASLATWGGLNYFLFNRGKSKK